MDKLLKYINVYKAVQDRFWEENRTVKHPKIVWRRYDHRECKLTKPICRHTMPIIDCALPFLDRYQTLGRTCTMMYALRHTHSEELRTEVWRRQGCFELYVPELNVRDPEISIHDIYNFVGEESDCDEDVSN